MQVEVVAVVYDCGLPWQLVVGYPMTGSGRRVSWGQACSAMVASDKESPGASVETEDCSRRSCLCLGDIGDVQQTRSQE